MVMQSTIDCLKAEIKRIEALPRADLILENLERLRKTVQDAEASQEATEEFYRRLNT